MFKKLLVATIVVAALPVSSALHSGVGAAPTPLPNLVIDGPRVASSITFKNQMFTAKDCAYVENSLTGTGKRTLMRFDVSAANRGTAPLVLGSPVGSPLFEYSACHKHYHFSGYALYELFAQWPIDSTTSSNAVLTGRKQAFCLEDFELDSVSPSPNPAVYTCANQGISVGWADTYASYLDGQWLDVTGQSPGSYYLRVTINPYNVANNTFYAPNSSAAAALRESSYSDNAVVVPVTIPAKIKG